MLRFGPESGPVAVIALPLFEEANRTRAFVVAICRALATRGVGAVLPDLPGQGESPMATGRATVTGWRAAFAAVPGSHAVAIRSGALVMNHRPCWLLAPQSGAELVRDLTRIKGEPLAGERVEVAGNLLSRGLIEELAVAEYPTGRTVRLASDPRSSDHKLDGPALWRRAEPDNDIAFAETLAADIADWIAMCEG